LIKTVYVYVHVHVNVHVHVAVDVDGIYRHSALTSAQTDKIRACATAVNCAKNSEKLVSC
jgi:hypothetical protein